MKIKIIMFLILGMSIAGVCFAQSDPNGASVTTKMNGYSYVARHIE